jgi:hypothetical protein
VLEGCGLTYSSYVCREGRSIVRLVGANRAGPPVLTWWFRAAEGGFEAFTRLKAVLRLREETPACHYCELSHCGVIAAAYAADSVFSARESGCALSTMVEYRAQLHAARTARSVARARHSLRARPFTDGDRLSGKSSIKRLSGS